VRKRAISTWAAVVGLAGSVSLAAGDGPAAPAPVSRVRLSDRYAAATVARVLAGARHRLEKTGCQRIYTEFADVEGRPLRDALAQAGTSGPEFLGSLLFYDGTGQARCETSHTLAFTWPHSPVVFVCQAQFTSAARHDPSLAEAVLIHESLHGLGLGENPPTSGEITARVLSRCSG
jgi:hypothetical protein